MLQSLAKIDYPQNFFDDFAVTCVDEIHNICSKTFSKVLFKTACKYTIGLSATPKRADGCEYIFKWFIGDIAFQSHTLRNGLPPTIQILNMNSQDYKEVCIVNKSTGKKQIVYSSMISELINMAKRNKIIIELAKHLITTDNRKILILSDRREHLKTLKVLLDQDLSVTFTYGLFIGSMKIADLERNKSCQLILATYQAFGEGVNARELDTMFLITPKKFIGHLTNSSKNESGKLEQIVGRIFRKDHLNIPPLIVDIQDNFSIYKFQSSQRLTFYKHHFQHVNFIHTLFDMDKYDPQHITHDCIVAKKVTKQHNDNDTKDNIYQTCLLD
jgi:superfamily II DNA or RNA helicase